MLYEVITDAESFSEHVHLGVEMTVPVYHAFGGSRITSYNVCYTKLLRYPGFGQAVCHHPGLRAAVDHGLQGMPGRKFEHLQDVAGPIDLENGDAAVAIVFDGFAARQGQQWGG